MAGNELGELKIEVVETDRTSNVQEKGQRKGKKLPKEKTREAKFRQWLDEVKEKCSGDADHAEGGECCIFTVPKSLKDLRGKKAAYEPQIVSLGPFHFLKNADLESMEKIKSEVVRSIQTRMYFQHGERDFFSKVVEEIKRNENSIRNCYDREKQLDSDILQLMMARDASFILQFFRQRLLSKDVDNEYCIRYIKSLPLMDTLKDIAKLENQVPLSVLKTILRIEIETGKSEDKLNEQADKELKDMLKLICKRLFPINRGDNFSWNKEKHILECLRSYVVGDVKQKSTHDLGKINYFDSFIYHVFQWFLWIVYVIMYPCIWKRKNDEQKILPTAVELQKAGVKFRPSLDGIQGIRFDQRRSTLYLPEIKVDIHTDTVIRNIMAFELCSSGGVAHQNAVTRYAHLMDQLINTEKDVAILSKSNIINNKLENDSKVADLWNSLTDSTAVPKYDDIDKPTEALKKYYQRRRTTLVILWNEFLDAHCSKPWHVLALVASLIILTLTVSTGFLRILPAINVINAHGGA